MQVIETLEGTIESLYRFALELDNVPVSALRLFWLQKVMGDTYVQNDDGDWLHASGEQLRVRNREWTIGLTQGDINTLAELTLRKSDPGYFLLKPTSLGECEEILDAKFSSPEHTCPAMEKRRQEIAAERGVPYVPPVGEGVIKTNLEIQQNLYNAGALADALSDRGKGRHTDLPPIEICDASGILLHPLEDILHDMTPRERGIYERSCKQNRKKGFPAGSEYAKKLAAEAIREARQRGTEGLWRDNLRGQLWNRVVGQYEALGYYRDINLRREVRYNGYTGMGERDSKGYLRYPANGYDLDTPVEEGTGVTAGAAIHPWPVVLCWAQLRAIARMHLHNQLVELHDEGKLPGIDITGRAPRTDNPAVQVIARAHGGSYLDFLREVGQHGSEGLLRGEPAGNPDAAKRAAVERMKDIEQSMVITDSVRQTVPKWFVRRLVDRGRLPPSPLHGHPERIGRVEDRGQA